VEAHITVRYPKVIYLGGTPMLGKTTAARILASRLGYSSISTDDIGVAVGAVTKRDRPEIDHREYYIVNSLEDLIQDINAGHEHKWPATRAVIRRHEAWDYPLVIEGYALRPSYVHSLTGDISGVFLVADEALIEKRVRASDFSEGASDVELMIERYCARSFWYNAMLREEVARLGLKALEISDGMQPEEIVDQCLSLLSRDGRQEQAAAVQTVTRKDPNPEDTYPRTTRAQCIVCRGDKLLMVQHHCEGVTWWCLPGGAAEPGETQAQAALRELQEECCVSGVILQKTSHWMDSAKSETVTFLVDIGEQTPRINTAAKCQGMDPYLTDVQWMALAEIPERDRAFLWAAGLLGIETFWAEVSKWGLDVSYPRSCE
jgi:8-oxo-dGTP pyrophosphatase MutT (NUDIX family)